MPVPSIICVPLMSPSPSLGPNSSTGQPSSRKASAEAICRPSGITTSPSPINGSTRCASGAKSPEAPNDPWLGTTGNTPAFQWSSRRCTVVTATPEWPWLSALTFNNSMALTTSAGSGSPTPHACEINKFRCKPTRSSTRVVAKSPNPVLMPYKVPPPEARSSK